MLDENKIFENKERFIDILSSVDREGISELVEALCKSDFFETVASTKFHSNYKGGLCQHSLNVYDNMMILRDKFYTELPTDSVIICALLHDISKIDFYTKVVQNKKSYSANGRQSDSVGKFDWVQVETYKIKEPEDRSIVFSEHGTNSFILANKYIKLTPGETAAIINHHAGMDNGFVFKDLNEAMNRYPALTLLHMADMLTCYINENPYMIEEE